MKTKCFFTIFLFFRVKFPTNLRSICFRISKSIDRIRCVPRWQAKSESHIKVMPLNGNRPQPPINKWIAIDVFHVNNKRKNCSLTLCQHHELTECVIKIWLFVGLNGYLRGKRTGGSMTERYHHIAFAIQFTAERYSRLFYSAIRYQCNQYDHTEYPSDQVRNFSTV